MADEIFMDTAVVETWASKFEMTRASLEIASVTIELQMLLLQSTALKGLIGNCANDIFANELKPVLDTAIQKHEETANDIKTTVTDWINGAQTGANRFKN